MFDVGSMFDGAVLPKDGISFIDVGDYELALCDFKLRQKDGEPPSYQADFLVLASETHAVGDIVSAMFFPYATWYPKAGSDQSGRIYDLFNKLFDKELTKEQVKVNFEKLLAVNQPGRGLKIKANGRLATAADGTPKLNKKGNKIVNVSFYPVKGQDGASVAAQRAIIDALPKYAAGAAPVAVAQPAPVAVAPDNTGLF